MTSVVKRYLGLLVAILPLACAQHPAPGLTILEGRAQGTYYMVKYYSQNQTVTKFQVDSLLVDFDKTFSLWDTTSLITQINQGRDVELTEEFVQLFGLSKQVFNESEGAFDPTVGALVDAWGFGFSGRRDVNDKLIDSILPLIGFDKVNIINGELVFSGKPVPLNFNAIAQGYSVGVLGRFLELNGINDYLIDPGGEVYSKGRKPEGKQWVVGIQKPTNDEMGEVESQAKNPLENNAFVTSGNYRKFFIENGIKYSHTIDPSTGYPVQHSLLSASVLGPNPALCDAYATVCMVKGVNASLEFMKLRQPYEVYLIYSGENGEMKEIMSKGMDSLLIR